MCTDFKNVAHALVKNGSEAFHRPDGFVLDVLDLKADVEEEEEAEEDEEEEGEEEGDEGAPRKKRKTGPAGSPKEKVWVERDRVVSSTTRAVQQAVSSSRSRRRRPSSRARVLLEDHPGPEHEEQRAAPG